MTEYITIYDYLLLPPFLYLFYLIIKKRSRRYEGTELKKYFIHAFWLRMVGSILCGMLFQYYYGYGDTFGFYMGSDVISDMIQKDISNLKLLFYSADDVVAAAKAAGFGDAIPINMGAESNVTIMKISAILSFFTFNKYLLICIAFGLFSFVGIWKLYCIFYELNGRKHGKLLAIAILYMPSLWMWGGGLLKEPICVGALGIAIHLLYKMFVKKMFSFRDLLLLALMVFIVTIVKAYITAIFLIALFMMLFALFMKMVRIKIFRYAIEIVLLVGGFAFITFADLPSISQPLIDASFDRIETFKNSYEILHMQDESSKAGFMLPSIVPTFESLLLNAPAVIATCLYRPFIWESEKIILVLASLEAMLTMLATLFILWKTKFFGFFAYLFTDPVLLFCFVFSILFALLIGYTTFNFGTMVRYKIIFLPFYFGMLVMIYTKHMSVQET